MFSSGQLIFAIVFVIGFIALMIFSYRKDRKLHQKNYKGSKWILVGFFAFVVLLSTIMAVLRNLSSLKTRFEHTIVY